MNELAARLGQGAGAQPLLPLPNDPALFETLVAEIKAGPEVDAFARKRATQILTHGHTPEADLAKAINSIAREAKARLHMLTDYVVPGRMNLPHDRRKQCVGYIETSGAILLSLHARVHVEVPEDWEK